jgi:hypothetical protein
MGNSQSAAQAAIEEAQKPTHVHHNRPFLPAQVEEDPEYTRLRSLAHEEAEKRNNCFEASQTAYKNRQGARGEILRFIFFLFLLLASVGGELYVLNIY